MRAYFDIAILNVAERPFANTSGVGDLLLGRELLALLPDCFYLRAVDNNSFHTRSPRFAIPRSLCTPPLASRRRHRIGTRQARGRRDRTRDVMGQCVSVSVNLR